MAWTELTRLQYVRTGGRYAACAQANDGDRASTAKMSQATKEEIKRIKDLERELARKDRAMTEAAALRVLRKYGICDLGG